MTGASKTCVHNSDRGNVMTKHLCGNCGTPLNAAREGMLGLRAGMINEHADFAPKANVYASSKMNATILDDGI